MGANREIVMQIDISGEVSYCCDPNNSNCIQEHQDCRKQIQQCANVYLCGNSIDIKLEMRNETMEFRWSMLYSTGSGSLFCSSIDV